MTKQTQPPYTVERYVREETNDYGRAGQVEWRVRDSQTLECLEVLPTRWQAKAMADALNRNAAQ